ncbi:MULTISPECIES: restriction endonuclease [Archaeoglobus]|uniref:Uncharacterized protein AF_2337 n=1 Tax=Archaeoglobus fulgidus (strain ATCC 49558 / DSM 4304 / JCM 9628 / NBRC 100126 / VC-16) TaxID=224325 RepID=Y2337_ARCFU|nr:MULTISPECIES: restriction endonuclease [Archaeoglobus]O27947.1 RecName: Full=Uncharacterized protein AF_2337 [Archaeoglobus fulgidus DSM 4304]AAB88915.1 conserved hypothetical protein [Archaeoglobus fulgidus DSM 4304]MDI3497810.1 hypothetical protein [Archaeoglobus sp.]
MRLKKEDSILKIFIREDFPYFVDKFLNDTLPAAAYYSKDGELCQIHVSKHFFENEEPEYFIPDRLPARKYVFTFGKESTTPKICVDSHKDFNSIMLSGFEFNEMMIIERADGGEIEYYDRYRIREDFLSEWVENGWFTDFGRSIVESVYFKKKLYFYVSSESYDFSSIEEFEEVFSKYLERMDYKVVKSARKGKFSVVDATKNGKKEKFLLVKPDYEDDSDSISKEELESVTKRIRKNLRIIMDYEDDLSEDAMKWAREQGIEVKTIDEFMKEFMLREWEENDRIAAEDPEFWEDVIRDIFGG